MKHIKYCILSVVVAMVMTALSSCIEDGFTSSPSSQPTFSVDTLALGNLFTGESSPTYTFKVFNRNSKSINISSIRFTDDNNSLFSLNVDGMAGKDFSDIEVRENDSIFIFVQANLPDLALDAPLEYERHLEFTTNGVTRTVVVTACGIDATRLTGHVFHADAVLDATRPYIIYDSLIVAENATLTLRPGTKLHFHDKAMMRVDGTLHATGSPDQLIEMTGDRWGNVVGRVDYEIMSGQWEGVIFTPTSRANSMSYTSIRNTMWGVIVDSVPYSDGVPSLSLLNCQLRNSKDYALLSSFSAIEALGCELADASSGVVALQGGTARMVNCTIANYYLFTVLGGPAMQFYHVTPDDVADDNDQPLLAATIDNCIIYGNGTDLSHGDLNETNVTLRNCLLKSDGTNDEHFIECMWDIDPMYGTVRQDYHFDYRLKPESPAIGKASAELIPAELIDDMYGVPRLPGLNLGAYSGELAPE